MDVCKTHGDPVLIIGAGRGGMAMIEMFEGDEHASVVGVMDANPGAPGLALAARHGIRTFTDAKEALHACAPCLVINLTHDEAISGLATRIVGADSQMSGQEAKLVWQMVTQLKNTRDELERSQKELQAVILTAADGIIVINEHGEIVTFNPAAEGIFGYAKAEILGKNINLLMPEPEHSQHQGYLKKYLKTGVKNLIGSGGREVTGLRKDGCTFPMDLTVNNMTLHDGQYFVGILRDITDRKVIEDKIRLMAHYDHLTGLPNRSLLFDRLQLVLAQANRHKQKVAALFLDLDGFKSVNDTYGHDVGDLLLQEVARRLLNCVRESDTVARIGGDEFVILLTEVTEKEDVAQVAAKIIASLADPVALKNAVCHIGGSMGIALFPDDAKDGETLLKKADDGMYHAKRMGKNNYKFYDE